MIIGPFILYVITKTRNYRYIDLQTYFACFFFETLHANLLFKLATTTSYSDSKTSQENDKNAVPPKPASPIRTYVLRAFERLYLRGYTKQIYSPYAILLLT